MVSLVINYQHVDIYQRKHIQIRLMEDNVVEDEDIEFSMIVPEHDKHKQLDFSVNELLSDPQTKSNSEKNKEEEQPEAEPAEPEGSFMRDLQKMEKSISYQTNPYDIYEPSQQQAEFTGTVEAKIQDTCTKTTNNLTKICEKNLEFDFKHLIIDFTEERMKFKVKQVYEDYFEGQILKTKKIDQKIQQKDSKSKGKQRSLLSSKFLHVHNRPNLIKASKQTSPSKKNNQKLLSSSQRLTQPSQILPQKNIVSSSSRKSKQKASPLKSINKLKPGLPTLGTQTPRLKTLSTATSNSIKSPKHRPQQQSQIYSQYFGFQAETKFQKQKISKTGKDKKTISRSKSKSKSKGKSMKKIVFSNKNVHLCQ